MTVDLSAYKIAAIVPCHNEEVTVRKVVADLKAAVPSMDVYVYNNNSSDRTVEEATAAGAIVRHEERPGKGNVVRRAFADVEADIYVMVDGDDTYEASHVPDMIEMLVNGPYDHILGVRRDTNPESSYCAGHEFGNRMFNVITSKLFGTHVSDMLSGYRVFSRRFVKSFPAVSKRFEIETELTIHMMSLRLPCAEYSIDFRDRPEGSESKLSTVSDGFKILGTIAQMMRHERPNLFYGSLALLMVIASLVCGVPVIVEFMNTGLVPRFPTALLAVALMIIAAIFATVGIIGDALRRVRRESARLHYLELLPPNKTVGLSESSS